MTEHAEFLKEARELAAYMVREDGDAPPPCPARSTRQKIAVVLRTLVDLVEKYHKSNAQLIAACNSILAGPVDEPQIELTGEHHTGLHCGLEDRDICDRYDACDYGFEKGVERTLEWAQGIIRAAPDERKTDEAQ